MAQLHQRKGLLSHVLLSWKLWISLRYLTFTGCEGCVNCLEYFSRTLPSLWLCNTNIQNSQKGQRIEMATKKSSNLCNVSNPSLLGSTAISWRIFDTAIKDCENVYRDTREPILKNYSTKVQLQFLTAVKPAQNNFEYTYYSLGNQLIPWWRKCNNAFVFYIVFLTPNDKARQQCPCWMNWWKLGVYGRWKSRKNTGFISHRLGWACKAKNQIVFIQSTSSSSQKLNSTKDFFGVYNP